MATASEEIKILITSEVEKAVKGMKATEKGIGDLGKKSEETSKKTEKAFGGMVDRVKGNFLQIAAAGAAAFAALNKAGESLKLAADFADQSDAVEKQFGVTTKQITAELGKATKGQISNTKLLTMASRSMSLGVTNDLGKMSDMLKYAEIRGDALGKSTEEVFGLMVDGIGKQNPRMLKELGFTADAFKDTADGAEAAMTKSEMMGVVMGEVSESVKQFGDENISLADSLGAIEAAADNAKIELGQALMPVGEALIPIIRNLIAGFSAMPGPVKALGVSLSVLVPLIYAVYAAMGPVGLVIAGASLAIMGMTAALGHQTKKAEEARVANQSYLEGIYGLNKAEGDHQRLVDQETKSFEKRISGLKSMAEKTAVLNGLLKEKSAWAEREKAQYEASNDALTEKNKELEKTEGHENEATQAMVSRINKERYALEESMKLHHRNMVLAGAAAEAARQLLQDVPANAAQLTKTLTDINEFIKKNDVEVYDERIDQIDKWIAYLGAGSEKAKALTVIRGRIETENITKRKEEEKKAIDASIQAQAAYFDYLDEKGKAELLMESQKYATMVEMAKGNADELRAINWQHALNIEAIKERSLEYMEQKEREYEDKQMSGFNKYANFFISAAETVITTIRDIALAAIDTANEYQDQLDALSEERNATEMTRRAEDYEDQKATLEKKVADATVAGDTVAANEAQRDLIRLTQDREYQVKREALEVQAAEREKAIKEKQWTAQHNADVAMAWINVAKAVMAGLTAPFPLSIPSSIINGAAATAQAVIISSQKMPKYASGTTNAQGGLSVVGERGIEVMNVPKGATIYPNSVSAPVLQELTGEGLRRTINNATTNNAQKTFVFNVKADDPVAMVNKIRRQYGDSIFR